jgi:uncharacterized protein
VAFTTLMIKATRLCNLRCAYCYDWRAGKDQTMSFQVLATMTAKALRDPEVQDVEFAWHGGETTLLPVAFYENALLLQAKFRRPGQRIHNGIQTNGIRLSSAWVDFLRKNRFRVGVSIDGPPEVHDLVRADVAGRPTLARVLDGVRQLRAGGIEPSILMVLDDAVLRLGPDRLFEFIVAERFKRVGLLAAKPAPRAAAAPRTPADHYMPPATANAFFARLFDRWRQHGDPTIRIRELAGLESHIRGAASGFCTLSGKCFGSFFVVEPSGTVGHCDYFVGDDRYRLGNILTDDFPALRASERLAVLEREEVAARRHMQGCPEYAVCNGWCPYERYVSMRHDSNHDPSCCGLRDLIGHIRSATCETAAS